MSQPAHNTNENLPEGVHLTSDLTVLMTTAMALGAIHTNIHQFAREEYSGNDLFPYHVTTNTTISFDFYDPGECVESPYVPPPGVSIEETSRALLIGQFPVGHSAAVPPRSPPLSPALSTISISSADTDSSAFGNTSHAAGVNSAADTHACMCQCPAASDTPT